MTQALWYLRSAGKLVEPDALGPEAMEPKILGPFPPPRIQELLRTGDITPAWEISLDRMNWLTIAASDQFHPFQKSASEQRDLADPSHQSWQTERKQARDRWLQEQAELPEVRDEEADLRIRRALVDDEAKTETLLHAQQTSSPSVRIAVAALGLTLVIGGLVWWGQRENPIEAAVSQAVVNCGLELGAGRNWTGCDKRAINLTGVQAKNSKLARTKLDGAVLVRADLSYADLTGASLRNANLQAVVLTGAEMSDADLSGADLSNADLRYAVMRNVRLDGARMDGARLDKVVWLDGRVCAEGSLGQCL